MPYRVVVSDLSPCAGRAAPRVLGEFASAAQAVAACRAVVEAALQGLRQPGWGADDLFLAYTVQGPDAYVVGPPGESVGFSAWRHARERSLQWCEGRRDGWGAVTLPWLEGAAAEQPAAGRPPKMPAGAVHAAGVRAAPAGPAVFSARR